MTAKECHLSFSPHLPADVLGLTIYPMPSSILLAFSIASSRARLALRALRGDFDSAASDARELPSSFPARSRAWHADFKHWSSTVALNPSPAAELSLESAKLAGRMAELAAAPEALSANQAALLLSDFQAFEALCMDRASSAWAGSSFECAEMAASAWSSAAASTGRARSPVRLRQAMQCVERTAWQADALAWARLNARPGHSDPAWGTEESFELALACAQAALRIALASGAEKALLLVAWEAALSWPWPASPLSEHERTWVERRWIQIHEPSRLTVMDEPLLEGAASPTWSQVACAAMPRLAMSLRSEELERLSNQLIAAAERGELLGASNPGSATGSSRL